MVLISHAQKPKCMCLANLRLVLVPETKKKGTDIPCSNCGNPDWCRKHRCKNTQNAIDISQIELVFTPCGLCAPNDLCTHMKQCVAGKNLCEELLMVNLPESSAQQIKGNCPSCGSELVWTGYNIVCSSCSYQQ